MVCLASVYEKWLMMEDKSWHFEMDKGKGGEDWSTRLSAAAPKTARTDRPRNYHPTIDLCRTRHPSRLVHGRALVSTREASPRGRPIIVPRLCAVHNRTARTGKHRPVFVPTAHHDPCPTVRPGRHLPASGQNVQPISSARPNPTTEREFPPPRSTRSY
ncbi:unnamed protein product [Microthlaspi erraticum]|uniref:Uncharacterized protein n=1 Tax=Microthlaspi erraticum TaxID=1685480 RepID=A0A6D2LN01_9BRAS|nr:unnamed protein product [Microthlaspi erraticum]